MLTILHVHTGTQIIFLTVNFKDTQIQIQRYTNYF